MALGVALALCGCVTYPPPTRGDTLTIITTNSIGQPDTSTIHVLPISTPINANGSFFITGVGWLMFPDTNGVSVQTNVQKGNYMATNSSGGLGQGILFALPGNGQSYNAAQPGIAISGFNIFNFSPGVQLLVAGTGISVSPSNGMGTVTITGTNSPFATNSSWSTNLASGGTLAGVPVFGGPTGFNVQGSFTARANIIVQGQTVGGAPSLEVDADTFGDPILLTRNSGGVQALTIDNSGDLVIKTNALSSWPAAATTPGDAVFVNSNGWLYVLASKFGSTAWTKTNLISAP